ncbi:hypothetical protein HPB50_013575 [Hyalomma asiaticum]|uniref:Uncharacterized protein n=1 Tax=Hyalomma asiaticum TaxID=266040 RepID=A0ACB7RT16_HYAAI|nr:hypothetical protein HPB50_013575 [Hyalomma asiaticum]
MEPWLKELLTPNSALNELRVDLYFGLEEYRAFLAAVAQNETLKLIILGSITASVDIEALCKTIRAYGLSDRIAIRKYYVVKESLQCLPKYPEVSTVAVMSSDFPARVSENEDLMGAAFDVLRRCDHVTSIHVVCDKFFSFARMSALAAYITFSSALTKVEVDLRDLPFTPEERREMESLLVAALACNPYLAEINIKGATVSEEDLDVLLNAARGNWNLTLCSVTEDAPYDLCKVRAFLSGFAFHLNKHEIERECTERNSSLVRAAVEYVLGEGDAAKGARAIELVHGHPDVLGIVRECTAVKMGEARSMIRRSLRSVGRCSLADFMRMAGVVRDKVECVEDQPGAAPGLWDINYDCWLNIRKYLKIADVVEVRESS